MNLYQQKQNKNSIPICEVCADPVKKLNSIVYCKTSQSYHLQLYKWSFTMRFAS